MLALDHRGSFKKFVDAARADEVSDAEAVAAKRAIIAAARAEFSGVLIDPIWGLSAFAQAMADKPAEKRTPFLLCLEKSGYEVEGGERATELEYTANQLKNWGAAGAKLLVYFNPEAKNCAHQLAVSRRALSDAHAAGLPLFLEIVTYGNEELNKSRHEWVLRSVQAFLEAGIVPDVFKLEYPGNKDACKKITALLGNIPWILLTRGESFAVFAGQLRVAIGAGAAGFLAGRALWQEIGQFTGEERNKFLQITMRKRFGKINRIALKQNLWSKIWHR